MTVASRQDRASFYLPWLDGLRAGAALLVMLSHSALLLGRPGAILSPLLGSFGVYVFLTLSAFLLSRLLLLEWRETGRLALARFWVRRALRIWPLYALSGIAAAGWALDSGMPPMRVLGQLVVHFAFLEDVSFPLFGWAAALPYAAQLWTISLEEQVYFLLPLGLAAYFARQGGARHLRMVLIAIAVIGAAARAGLILLGAGHVSIWVSPLHPDAVLVGLWLGLQSRIGTTERAGHRAALWLLGSLAALAGVALLGPPIVSIWAEIYAYPALAIAAMMLMIGIAESARLTRLLGAPVPSWLGKISYGIYVWHVAMLTASNHLLQYCGIESPILQLAVAVPITVIVAALSYRLIERPFLVLKLRFATIRNRPP